MITPEGFDEFVVTRSPRLLRTAFLLTRDWALAEDLLPAPPRLRHRLPTHGQRRLGPVLPIMER
ncbi:hypothetical protein ACQPYA_21650 [Micromonospora sp. CA-263727]|uniref:hypothetical protein n=1 Tax=Micromonospora sp. CA-263727 TaxID=3239967 RepID=UPI003D8AD361